MQTTDKIISYLKQNLSEKRFAHTMGVAETARSLAEVWGEDCSRAFVAGLVHDCAKEVPYDEMLRQLRENGYEPDECVLLAPGILHAPLGAIVAKKEFGIEDAEILDAVRFHTTGRPCMTNLEKIIYIADFTEPGRKYPEAEAVRELAQKDLDRAVLLEADFVIKFTVDKGRVIHPATIIARNYYVNLTKEGN